MSAVEYRDDELWCEGVPLSSVAREVETPCFVYSRGAMVERIQGFADAWPGPTPPTPAYSVRVNPARAILSLLESAGAWISLTTGMEMMQAFRSGFSPGRMLLSGLGKTEDEIRLALHKDLFLVVADSRSELDRLARVAAQISVRARTAIRVHPAGDHPSKVGIPLPLAEEVFRHASDTEGLEVIGLHLFFGRHLPSREAYLEVLDQVLSLTDRLSAAGVVLTCLDMGSAVAPLMLDRRFCETVVEHIGGRPLKILFEPGRTLVSQAGVLLTTVDTIKESAGTRYLVVDASMADLPSPALFGSEHPIVPVRHFEPPDAPLFDVVGTLYESGDVLGRGRALAGVVPGDLLCVQDTGAFGRTLSSNMTMKPRPPEILVDGDKFHVIRRRETFQDMVRTETDALG